ncbi:MAG TPA: hypothetical protein VGK73_01295 [Polyangiaceae bacterium]
MSLVAVTILAQTLAASVGDRAELRYLHEPPDSRMELEDRAFLGASFGFPWAKLRASYAPSVLVSPLESSNRQVFVEHALDAGLDTGGGITLYQGRRTVLRLQLAANYSQRDVRRQLLGAPAPQGVPRPPTESPDPPDPNQPAPSGPEQPEQVDAPSSAELVRATDQTVYSVYGRAGLALNHRFSGRSVLDVSSGYGITSGLGRTSLELSPLLHLVDASAGFRQAVSRRDTLVTTLSGYYDYGPREEHRSWYVSADQGLLHVFSARTLGEASVGVAYTLVEEQGVRDEWSVAPKALLALNYNTRLARGQLSLRISTTYAPVLDRSTLVFDKRFDVYGSASWTRRRLNLYANVQGTISAEPDDPGSLNSVAATAGWLYDLGAGFTLDQGVRAAWQTFEGEEVIRPSWALFLAINWNFEVLNEKLW